MIIVHLICMFLMRHLSLFCSQIFNWWYVVISIIIVLKQFKNYIKFHLSIGKFTIPITFMQRTSNIRAIVVVSSLRWDRSQYIFKPSVSGKLCQSTTVSCQLNKYFRPEHGILCILIGKLTLKSALLLFTLLITIKPHFEKRPVIGNPTKCL